MNERESWQAGREAGRERKAHPQRATGQEGILRYLGGAFYAEQRKHRRAATSSAGAESAAASDLVVDVHETTGSVAALDQAATRPSRRRWSRRVGHVLPWVADVAHRRRPR